jgi:transposase
LQEIILDLSLPDNIEELKQLIYRLLEEIETLKQENALLKQENSELKARLNQNSSNSSKPPSTDFFNRKPAFTKPLKGKKGGQFGHKGDTLNQISDPDKIIKCLPNSCGCGHNFSAQDFYFSEKRQVFDLPVPKLDITEYQLFSVKCSSCGKVNKGSSPENVNSQVQYGNGVRAYITLLNTVYKLPYKKVQGLFQDLFGYPINESTIFTTNARCYDNLKHSQEIICNKLQKEKVVQADETGIKIEKENYWLHILSSNNYTYQFVHKKRGKEALTSKSSIIGKLQNWLVHDCWSSYFNVQGVSHALCGAHLIRELQGVIENNENNTWAIEMKKFLLDLNKMDFNQRLKTKNALEKRYSQICLIAEKAEPPPIKIIGKRGKTKKTKARNLLERLIKHQEPVLAFAFNESVPFTNNLAERDLRPVKIKLKVSNCFRSFEGAAIYARIESFVSTARKNSKNIFEELKNTFEGQNFLTLYET